MANGRVVVVAAVVGGRYDYKNSSPTADATCIVGTRVIRIFSSAWWKKGNFTPLIDTIPEYYETALHHFEKPRVFRHLFRIKG